MIQCTLTTGVSVASVSVMSVFSKLTPHIPTGILDTMIVGGVLGPIKAYFGTVESQGRGSLHLYPLIWLDHDMKPTDMKEKIQHTDFREKLKSIFG